MTPAQRAERAGEKRKALLRFLRDEIYTTTSIAALLLGLGERQARRTVAAMEREALLRTERVEVAPGYAYMLHGITAHGQAFAFDPATEQPSPRYFGDRRVSPMFLPHALTVQRLRLQAERAGWRDWTPGDRLAGFNDESRPDAVAVDANGVVWCIEAELTIKTTKRYQSVLFSRLRAIKEGRYARVVWVCKDAGTAARLRAIIFAIREFTREHAGQKQRVTIDPGRHHALLHFTNIDQFPTSL